MALLQLKLLERTAEAAAAARVTKELSRQEPRTSEPPLGDAFASVIEVSFILMDRLHPATSLSLVMQPSSPCQSCAINHNTS